MSNVFISYKSDARGYVGFIVALLEEANVPVWWDQKLLAGTNFGQVIQSELENSACVVVCWTENSGKSDWVRGEAKLALDAGKLVPVLLETCSIPIPFNVLHTINLTKWKGSPNDPAWISLLTQLAMKIGPTNQIVFNQNNYHTNVISKLGHLVHKLKARDSTGRWAYYFVLVMPAKEQQFLSAIEGDGIVDLEDFGTVIASSYGEQPSAEVRTYLKARYNFEV